MLSAYFENDTEQSAILEIGEVELYDVYVGRCCSGCGWEIVSIYPDESRDYNSYWGICSNPDCPKYQPDIGPENDHFRGVSNILHVDFVEWLAYQDKEQKELK